MNKMSLGGAKSVVVAVRKRRWCERETRQRTGVVFERGLVRVYEKEEKETLRPDAVFLLDVVFILDASPGTDVTPSSCSDVGVLDTAGLALVRPDVLFQVVAASGLVIAPFKGTRDLDSIGRM